jgi:hypothetical protein
MKGTIKAIAMKTRGILFVSEDEPEGRWYTCSEKAFPYAKKGMSADIDLDSSSATVIKIRVGGAENSQLVTPQPSRPTSSTAEFYQHYQNKERAIVRQSSLKCAVDLCKMDKIALDQLLDFALKFENWVFREEDLNEDDDGAT